MFEQFITTNHRTPKFKITVITKDKQQKDLTTIVSDRLISLSISDNRGFEADMLDLELSDHDGQLALPPRNAVINVAIGWQGEQLIDKGSYLVDEVQFSGAPDKVNIRARSADLKGSLSEKKERSFDNVKLGAVVEQIAKENGLNAMVSEVFKHQIIKHIDQTSESDINLLSRLAQEYDAIATVKKGTLLFMPAGTGKTASGKNIPAFEITRKSGDNYQFSIVEADNYKAVRAYWYNTDTGKKGEVIIDENSEVKLVNRTTKTGKKSKLKKHALIQNKPIESDSEQIKTLRNTYKYEASAIQGAKSAFDKLKRGVATFSLNLAMGEPELSPETPIVLSGFKKQIDSSAWVITAVTHNITDSGYTAQVEMELKIEEEKAE